MARETTSTGSGKHFYVKAKNLKPGIDAYPTLELQQKNPSTGAYEVVQEVTALSGWITSIEKVDKPKSDKHKRIRGVKFTMTDPKTSENYHFDLTYSNPVRELLNRMAGLGSFEDELRIAFYRGDKGYAGASLKKTSLGQSTKVEIKYSYKEHIEPRIKKVVLNGETQSDYEKVDEFFDSLIEKVLVAYKTQRLDGTYIPASQGESEFTPDTQPAVPLYERYDSNGTKKPEVIDNNDDTMGLPF